ncbi:MAG: 2-methylcitrate dehydratase, partial [Nevskia sp.]|nr:2-methylcitrate dehydratase [Nevskia sp.]
PVLVEKFKSNLALKIAPKNTAKIMHIAEDQARLEATPVQDFVSLFVV